MRKAEERSPKTGMDIRISDFEISEVLMMRDREYPW
jgi:hypothetical protein